MAQLEPLMQRNFLEYASYVVLDRAIPDLRDGLKPVQRRILNTLFEMHDGRFHKVANVIGETMKLHPHGDAAIGDALVVLANKEYFIERQGNFGNLVSGHPAAAARYIECRLTELARETLYNKAITQYVKSYDGRKEEPVCFPAKLPVLLLVGAEGIAVGMSTRILPHNFVELLEAQIDLLQGKERRLFPDFPTGGLVDVSDYDDGRGRVLVRAKVQAADDKRILITEIPFGTTTESLIHSMETAAQKGTIKIASINDYTTEKVEIEINLPRGVYAKEVIPQLYAYTDCEVSVSSNMVAIHEGRPVDLSVTQVLAAVTDLLLEVLKAELTYELGQLRDKQHWLTLEQLFVEQRVYKRIEEATSQKEVAKEVWDGMHVFEDQFARAMVEDDVERLLQVRIRRISLYDIEKNRKDLEEVAKNIKVIERKLRQMKKTAIAYLQGLIDKYGKDHRRRSRMTTFQTVDKKAVARADIKVSYDPATGFFGSKVKGAKYEMTVSQFHRILAISRDGSYRIMAPPEKALIPGKVLYCSRFDESKGLSVYVVFRDKKKIVYAKKVHIHKFIKDKEYTLIKDKGGRIEMLVPGEQPCVVQMEFVPAPRQRVREATFDLSELEPTGVTAKGRRLAPKPVAKVTRLRE